MIVAVRVYLLLLRTRARVRLGLGRLLKSSGVLALHVNTSATKRRRRRRHHKHNIGRNNITTITRQNVGHDLRTARCRIVYLYRALSDLD